MILWVGDLWIYYNNREMFYQWYRTQLVGICTQTVEKRLLDLCFQNGKSIGCVRFGLLDGIRVMSTVIGALGCPIPVSEVDRMRSRQIGLFCYDILAYLDIAK